MMKTMLMARLRHLLLGPGRHRRTKRPEPMRISPMEFRLMFSGQMTGRYYPGSERMPGGIHRMVSITSTILTGDSLEQLKTIPDDTVNTCVTSPPYYGLRDYGVDGQIGT